MIQTQERRPLRGGVQQLGGVLDPQYLTSVRAAIELRIEANLAKVYKDIGQLDRLDGDADLEPNGDYELTGDERDASFTEWTSRGRNKDVRPATAVTAEALWNEDDEDADPREDDDPAGGSADDVGEVDTDLEHEQMDGDVPCPSVFALEPDPANGMRQLLGRNCSNPDEFVGNRDKVCFA